MIKAILECINSLPDASGNRYWAFRYTDTKTGKQVNGCISGGSSNILAIPYDMGLQHYECYCVRTEMKKRDFKALTGEWSYAGCASEEIAKFINKELEK